VFCSTALEKIISIDPGEKKKKKERKKRGLHTINSTFLLGCMDRIVGTH